MPSSSPFGERGIPVIEVATIHADGLIYLVQQAVDFDHIWRIGKLCVLLPILQIILQVVDQFIERRDGLIVVIQI